MPNGPPSMRAFAQVNKKLPPRSGTYIPVPAEDCKCSVSYLFLSWLGLVQETLVWTRPCLRAVARFSSCRLPKSAKEGPERSGLIYNRGPFGVQFGKPVKSILE